MYIEVFLKEVFTMKNKRKFLWSIEVMLLFLFNTFAFFLFYQNESYFWINFSLVHFIYVILIGVRIYFIHKIEISYFFSIQTISHYYFYIVLFSGYTFLTYAQNIFIILFTYLFLILLLALLIFLSVYYQKRIFSQEEVEYAYYIKNIEYELNRLAKIAYEENMKNKIINLKDAFQNSEVKSYSELFNMEQMIMIKIVQLKTYILMANDDLVNILICELKDMCQERNNTIRRLKTKNI